MIDQIAASLPHVKITELLLEVDQWTGFTKHVTNLKSGDAVKDRTPLMTTILADAINLGLTKMAESCPGSSYAKLSWLQAWHIRDETYAAPLAELVNAQFRQPFAEHWGDGTTSSSEGQRFRTGSKAESTGHINPKYGAEPGKLFYTHISDQYAPFSSRSSTSECVTPLTSSTGCCTMSPTCGSRSVTPTRPASRTMSSLSCICSASASLHASAI